LSNNEAIELRDDFAGGKISHASRTIKTFAIGRKV